MGEYLGNALSDKNVKAIYHLWEKNKEEGLTDLEKTELISLLEKVKFLSDKCYLNYTNGVDTELIFQHACIMASIYLLSQIIPEIIQACAAKNA